MSKWVKNLSFGLIGAVFVLFTLIHFGRGNLITDLVNLAGDGYFVIRVEGGGKEFKEIDGVYELSHGRYWLNNLYSKENVVVRVGSNLIVIDNSVAEIEYDFEKTIVRAVDNNVEVKLFDKNLKGVNSEESFINSIVLPEGNEVTIYQAKIDNNLEVMKKLLLSKLKKELGYGVFDRNDKLKDEWWAENVAKDIEMKINLRGDFFESLTLVERKNESGQRGGEEIGLAWRGFSSKLIFNLKKRQKEELDRMEGLLLKSIYLYSVNRVDEGKVKFGEFLVGFKELEGGDFSVVREEIFRFALGHYYLLSFVESEEALFGLKNEIYKFLLNNNREDDFVRKMINDGLNQVSDLAKKNDLNQLKIRYGVYIENIRKYIDAARHDANYLAFLKLQNQVLDSLYLQSPLFMREEFVAVKLLLENKYLNLLPRDEGFNEEKLAVLLGRLNLMQRMSEFVLNREFELSEARKSVALVAVEANSVDLTELIGLGFYEIFRQKLEEFKLFEQFIASEEFVNSDRFGNSLKERFEQFKRLRRSSLIEEKNRDTVMDIVKEQGEIMKESFTPEEFEASGESVIEEVKRVRRM